MAREQRLLQYYGKFTPTGVDPGISERMQALAGVSKQIGDIAFQIGKKQRLEQGEKAGLEAGMAAVESGEPVEKKGGLFPTFFNEAYNNALQSSYVAGIENDARTDMARIAAENPDDIESFTASASEFRSGLLTNVSPEFHSAVTQSVDKLIAGYADNVQIATVNRQRKSADDTLVNASNTLSRDALRFASIGDAESTQDSTAKLFAAIDSRVEAGFINEASAYEQKRLHKQAVDGEVARAGLNEIISAQGVIGGVSYINQIADTEELDGFGVEEQRALVDVLRSDLSQHISMENAKETELKAQRTITQNATAGTLFNGIISGDVTLGDLTLASRNGDISFSQMTTLTNALNNKGKGFDDYNLIMDIREQMQNNPQEAIKVIQANSGTRLTESTASQLFSSAIDVDSEDSVLTQSVTKRYRRHFQDVVAPRNQFGFVDPMDAENAAKMDIVFDERVLAGENPRLVARDLIEANYFDDEPVRYGNKSNLEDAQEKAGQAYQNGEIDADTYDAEYAKIERMKKAKQAFDEFQNYYKMSINFEQEQAE